MSKRKPDRFSRMGDLSDKILSRKITDKLRKYIMRNFVSKHLGYIWGIGKERELMSEERLTKDLNDISKEIVEDIRKIK